MNINICIFGDSISWGASDFEKGGYVERLKSYCLENYDEVAIYNLGISGNTTSDLLKRFKNEATTRKPDLVIFAIGINDARYEKSKDEILINIKLFRKNIIKLIKITKKISSKVIFIGLTRVLEEKTMPIENVYYENNIINQFDDVLKNICIQNNIDYIEMKNVLDKDDYDDGLHPNTKGHEKIFNVVLENLKKYIK